MVQILLFILAFLYAAAGTSYLVGTIKNILACNEIKIIHGVRLMYAFVYGYLPFLIFYKESSGERNLAYYDYSPNGLFNLYFMFLFSVLAYMVLLFLHSAVCKSRSSANSFRNVQEMDQVLRDDRHVLTCGVIALFIGVAGLLLWTRAYGSIYNFILNASAIRSGNGKISNSFAFMKYVTKVVEMAVYALLAALIVNKPTGMRRWAYVFLLLLSIAGTVVYLLASDGRTIIAMSCVAVIAVLLKHRKSKRIEKYLIIAAAVAAVALMLTITADTFTRYFRTGVWTTQNSGVVDSIINEFKFIYSAQSYVINHAMSGTLEFKFLDDALIAITRWIPSRFIPFNLPDTVWAYNTTNIYGASASGTSPTDLLSTGIYYFGIPGVIIWPAAFGAIIGFIDNKLSSEQNSYFVDPYYALLLGVCIHEVSHNQISSFVLSLFPAFLYFLISYLVKSLRQKNEELGS